MDFKEILENKGFTSNYIETVEDEVMKVVKIEHLVNYVNNAPKLVQKKVFDEVMSKDDEELSIYLSKLSEGL